MPQYVALLREGLLEDGERLPEPRSLDSVMADPANRESVAFLVEVPVEPPKKIRVNVTLPEVALRRIDDYVRSHGLSRSSFLAQAALEIIARNG